MFEEERSFKNYKQIEAIVDKALEASLSDLEEKVAEMQSDHQHSTTVKLSKALLKYAKKLS